MTIKDTVIEGSKATVVVVVEFERMQNAIEDYVAIKNDTLHYPEGCEFPVKTVRSFCGIEGAFDLLYPEIYNFAFSDRNIKTVGSPVVAGFDFADEGGFGNVTVTLNAEIVS